MSIFAICLLRQWGYMGYCILLPVLNLGYGFSALSIYLIWHGKKFQHWPRLGSQV